MAIQKDNQNQHKGLVFAGLGMEVIGLMVGSVILGTEIDKYFGWKGYSVFFLLLSSFSVWVWHIIVLSKRMMKESSED